MKVKCAGKPWDPNLRLAEVRRSPRRTAQWVYRRLTAPWRGLPWIYLAGAKKSGTTSLFHYLVAHPRIFTPFRKEIKFFTYHRYLSKTWYRANFTWKRHLQNAYTLDATPDYLMHPCFARELHQLMPQARIILLLRDPVRRIISHYAQNQQSGIETLPFEEALRQEPARLAGEPEKICRDVCYNPWKYHRFGYLTESRYIEHLERLWQYFPKEQVLILQSEDFFAHPRQAIQKIAAFLAIEPWEADFKAFNQGQYQVPSTWQRTLAWLREYFRPYNERLYEALGRDMGWDA